MMGQGNITIIIILIFITYVPQMTLFLPELVFK
jgi:hypothetical protein